MPSSDDPAPWLRRKQQCRPLASPIPTPAHAPLHPQGLRRRAEQAKHGAGAGGAGRPGSRPSRQCCCRRPHGGGCRAGGDPACQARQPGVPAGPAGLRLRHASRCVLRCGLSWGRRFELRTTRAQWAHCAKRCCWRTSPASPTAASPLPLYCPRSAQPASPLPHSHLPADLFLDDSLRYDIFGEFMETVAASQVGPGGCFVSCGGMPSSTRLPACADVGAGRQGCHLHARLPASCHANAASHQVQPHSSSHLHLLTIRRPSPPPPQPSWPTCKCSPHSLRARRALAPCTCR